MTQKPSICRMVVVAGLQGMINNGATEAPAVITRVWSDTCVNLTVFLDSGSTLHRTSVALYDTPAEYLEAADTMPDGHIGAYWPPRV